MSLRGLHWGGRERDAHVDITLDGENKSTNVKTQFREIQTVRPQTNCPHAPLPSPPLTFCIKLIPLCLQPPEILAFIIHNQLWRTRHFKEQKLVGG